MIHRDTLKVQPVASRADLVKKVDGIEDFNPEGLRSTLLRIYAN